MRLNTIEPLPNRPGEETEVEGGGGNRKLVCVSCLRPFRLDTWTRPPSWVSLYLAGISHRQLLKAALSMKSRVVQAARVQIPKRL